MHIYLVGGAVRDALLGLPVTERDWVVVGATPELMLAQGFKPVGKDFPVFLHPTTNEEYALARTERKSGRGYAGFTFNTDPSVTLEDDLKRRDLTVNAIAQDKNGQLIDPYAGQDDIAKKSLRHVSEAFIEDPVRVLRVARFAARFYDLGFRVANDTQEFMRDMVANGELEYLVAERVWQELAKTLPGKHPSQFFSVLNQCGALPVVFPEWDTNADLAIMDAGNPAEVRFAVACTRAVKDIKAFIKRLRIPKAYAELAQMSVQWSDTVEHANTLDANALLEFLLRCDTLRRPERFTDFLQVCNTLFSCADNITLLDNAAQCIQSVSTQPFQAQGLKGQDFANALHAARLAALDDQLSR